MAAQAGPLPRFFRPPSRRPRATGRRIAVAMILGAIAGCSAGSGAIGNPFATQPSPQEQAQEIEPMLQAAGFVALPAATPEQATRLKTLPPLKLGYYLDEKGASNYWLADPDYCKCLFHGDEAAYQRFQTIKLENQMAVRDREAVEAQQRQQMMGPGGFGQPGLGFGSGGFGFGGGGFGIAF